MLAIIKKELKSYFYTPIGYIFIGLFLLVLSVFFNAQLFQGGSADFEYLFYNGATILTFLVPLLTMRVFSEEKKTGTDQILFTSPQSVGAIVVAKFIAASLIILITEGFTFVYYAILKYFSNPSLVLALNTLFGFLLLGMSYISIGMLISALTENQIIAAILTISVLLITWFVPTKDNIFGLMSKFEIFINGLINVADIITFASFTLMFLLLTTIALQRRKTVK